MTFKKLIELSPDELVRYQLDGTIPEHDPERDAAMLEAGWDPVTGAPIDREKQKRDEAKRAVREEELEDAEAMTVADHLKELRKPQPAHNRPKRERTT